MMLGASCSHCLTQHPVFQPFSSGIRVHTRLRNPSFLLPSSFRISDSRSKPLISISSFQKSKICCFRHEEFNPETPSSDFIDHILPEDLIAPNVDDRVEKRHWSKSFKQAADVLLRATGKPWTVPWTVETVVQVMVLWIASFWIVGSWGVPFVAHILGFSKVSLTYRGQALFSLLTDVAEGLVGTAIIFRCLSRFSPFPSDWFRFSLKGSWHLDVVLGCLMFPLVNRLSHLNLNLLRHVPSTTVNLSGVEQSIVARDPVAMAMYATVVAVCAPIWEEIIFRGFLLPSLTKYMPVWCAILISSVAFALVHFSAQRMLPLIFLGAVIGIVFTRSRNLLPCMLLHSLWNGFVFLDLMK